MEARETDFALRKAWWQHHLQYAIAVPSPPPRQTGDGSVVIARSASVGLTQAQ